MNRIFNIAILLSLALGAKAQVLTLDSCRAMALRANKQLSASRVSEQIAINAKKAARTKYLPHVDITAGYELTDKSVSILNSDQKTALSNIGTTATQSFSEIGTKLGQSIPNLVQNGIISAQSAQTINDLKTVTGALAPQLEAKGNALGQKIVDAFETDTRQMFAAAIMLKQPLYMGGMITAANDMADIAAQMAVIKTDAAEQSIRYDVDKAYWMVVSLNHKKDLADKYLALVQKLNRDVHKMIESGVATRADGLKVDVRVNEAEMTQTQVDNGLDLARMYLCLLCGLPLESKITLADEGSEVLSNEITIPQYNKEMSIENRPEIQLLDHGVKLAESSVKLARASYMPKLLLTGGYLVSNPNVYNGFERKLGGLWNVGVMLNVPVFDWGEGVYRIRSAKCATKLANLQLEEAREKIDLQVTQCQYRLSEANKKLTTAQKNIQRAEENMRCANVGFEEGVMQTTDVMAAQTAWLQAKTQQVDAEIELRLAEAGMKKALNLR